MKLQRAWDEYKMLADTILKYDNLIFIIKSWSITTFGALMTVYFTKLGSDAILFLEIILTIFYWVTDYIYKRFQSFQITRSRLLDLFLNGDVSTDSYRVPDVLFRNTYTSDHEQKILKHRGFALNKEDIYSQRIIRLKLFFSPQTSGLYLGQILSVIVVLTTF